MGIADSSRPIVDRGVSRRDAAAATWLATSGLDARPAGAFRIVADTLSSDGVDVLRIWHTPARLHRDARCGGIRLLIPLEGTLTVQPDDPSAVEVQVSPGEIAFLRGDSAFTLVTDTPSARTEIALERPLLGLLEADDGGAVVTGADAASRGILLSTVNATFSSPLDADSAAFPLVRAAVEQLAGAVLATSLPRDTAEDVYTRALALIAAMSADSRLSVQEICERLGVPKRTLQRTFAKNGTTVFDEIRRARLTTARALLGGSEVPPAREHALSGYVRSQRLQRDLRHLEATPVSRLG
ncbi:MULTISPECIES: helix-turn-helix domain-containing protein [unclassified Rathayibacter]|uniref:helix-turn-helix domain-containing protein n=1 Tax=unclassified Rathayibacter TaxID=2609250 RepID=UPI001E51AAF0